MKQGNRRRICFEVVAPPKAWKADAVQHWTTAVARILTAHEISYLNLPEVVNEARPGRRTIAFLPKMDHVRFGELVREQRPGLTLIPHKRCRLIAKESFGHWAQEIHDKHIRHIVVVGGESHKIKYKGFSVTEAAAFIKQSIPDIQVGGITIFTRKDEAERIVAKVKSGINFFLSQLIFEIAGAKQVLLDLRRQCSKERLELPDVYVSLAPAARVRDIEFMQWLGVKFPSSVLPYLTDKDEKRAEARTFEVLERLVDDLVNFMDKENFTLGFNIGHVVYANLELSEKLVELVTSRLNA